jgi:hypothetical protein
MAGTTPGNLFLNATDIADKYALATGRLAPISMRPVFNPAIDLS